jgi:hypothetical protein
MSASLGVRDAVGHEAALFSRRDDVKQEANQTTVSCAENSIIKEETDWLPVLMWSYIYHGL